MPSDGRRQLKKGGRQIAIFTALRQARQSLAEHRPEQAEVILKQALEISPGHPLLMTRLADVYLRQGHPARALALLEQVLKKHPRLLYARYLRGRALEAQQRWKAAKNEYRFILECRPADRFALTRMVRLLIRTSLLEEAEHWVAKARKLLGNPEVLFVLEMELQAARGQRRKVVAHILKHLKRVERLSLSDYLALLRLLARMDVRPITGLVAELQQSNPDLPSLAPEVLDELQLDQWLHLGRHREALAQLEVLQQRDPQNRFWRKQKGLLLMRAGKSAEAQEVLVPLFLENPSDLYVRNALASLFEQTGQQEHWRRLLRQALRQHPAETSLFGVLRQSHTQRDWLAGVTLSHEQFLQQVQALELPTLPFPNTGWQQLPLYALESMVLLLVSQGRLPSIRQVWDRCKAHQKARGKPGFTVADLERAYPAWLFGLQFYFLFAPLAVHNPRFVPSSYQRRLISLTLVVPSGRLEVDVSLWFQPTRRVRKAVVKTGTGYRWRVSPSPAARSIAGIPFFTAPQAKAWVAALREQWPLAEEWFSFPAQP